MATAGAPGETTIGVRPLDRGSPMPLWAQLHADLTRRIEAGAFVDEFPGEHTLAADYGVSRHTVREALRRLRADGIVVAERGRPPRLAAPVVIEQPLGALYSLFRAVEAAGMPQNSRVYALDIRTGPGAAAALGLPPDEPLVYLERLRLAGPDPLALDTAWLPASVARPLLEVDFSHTALYTELDRRCGITVTSGRENIGAVVLDSPRAAQLGLREPAAALTIRRIGYAGDRPVEVRDTVVRADRFSVSARFSSSRGYTFAPEDAYAGP